MYIDKRKRSTKCTQLCCCTLAYWSVGASTGCMCKVTLYENPVSAKATAAGVVPRSEKLNAQKNGCANSGTGRFTHTHFPSSGGIWVGSMRTADDTWSLRMCVCVYVRCAQVLGAWCSASCVLVSVRVHYRALLNNMKDQTLLKDICKINTNIDKRQTTCKENVLTQNKVEHCLLVCSNH